MSHHTQDPVSCEALSDDLLEFALGTLSGRDRSRVLEHLDTCSSCRAETESLARVTDAMLSLAPEAEPPLGFESRLADRLRGGEVVTLPRRRRGALTLAAAALLLAVLGFGIGAAVTHSNTATPSASSRPSMARLTSDGRVLGQVFVSPGRPSWIYMTFDDGRWSGVAWCQVTLASGRVETVGRFTLSSGYGAWVAPLKAPANQVRSAQLVDVNGTVLASATLRA